MNTEARTSNGAGGVYGAITLETTSGSYSISLNTRGTLTATNINARAVGIGTVTTGGFGGVSPVTVTNDGNIRATTSGVGFDVHAYGFYASTAGDGSTVDIVNRGDIWLNASGQTPQGARRLCPLVRPLQ